MQKLLLSAIIYQKTSKFIGIIRWQLVQNRFLNKNFSMVLLEILWINGNLLSLILAMQILEQPLINSYPSCGVLINQLLKTCLKFLLRYELLATFWLLFMKFVGKLGFCIFPWKSFWAHHLLWK